ncbi:hypothetical protein L6164_006078 [Bauhinia variegata]|uniref:Uncharacterized protein n=1 Tax=Bauhinia variegata TaxID=167791 RepID=A0ACB9PTF1_BAUVA|nr:hypothetical protein L6164_006078 [Bauhinia variegata]
MRTRFLNIDYFSLAPRQSRETLAFLHLPVPLLPSTLPSAIEDHLPFDSLLNVPLLIERLPIDAALSKFLSYVLPQSIDVDFQDSQASRASGDKECSSSFSIGSVGNRISEESEGSALSDKNKSVDKIIQFEAPEQLLLENAWFPEEEIMQILSESEVPGVEVNLEMLKPQCLMQYTCEVLESISSVDVTPEYYAAKVGYSLEDNISVQNLQHTVQSKFPVLEVDEESLGILTCLAMEKSVGSHFDDIRPQNLDTKYHFVIEGKELLGSMKYNIMDFFSVDCLSKQSLVLSDILPEREFIIMPETDHDQKNSVLQGAAQADSPLLVNEVTFEEFMFLEEDLFQTFEVFYMTQTLDDPETSEWMFKKDFNFKNFDELVVGSEMALIDDKFKSLPVPVMADHGKMISMYEIIGEMLYNLKTQPLSASDGIYLNWDLLEEDKCNSEFYHCCQNSWAKIDLKNIGLDGPSLDDGRVVFDLVFSIDAIGECDRKASEELQKLLSFCPSQLNDHTMGATLCKPLDDRSPKQGTGVQLAERNAERASLLFKSMSDVSNLDYFLNPQKATAKGHCNVTVESTDANVKVPKLTSTDINASCGCTGLQLHRVKLSENMVSIIGNFEKSYLVILQSETELIKTYNPAVDYFELLSLPKHKLMQFHGNGNNMAFIVLCAIKQAAWYLCFYGLHPAEMYVDKLCQNLAYLKSRLGYLQLLIKDKIRKVGDKINAVHPALTVFEEILRSDIERKDLKVLIVAEEAFWWSLKSLLLSLGMSPNVLHGNQPYEDMVKGADSKMKDLLISDCLIISYKHVSSLFPFNKFGIILEYGGPNCSSRISDLLPNSHGFPQLHFVNVELDGHDAFKALCEGVEMPRTTELLMENESNSIFDPKASMANRKLGKLLNFCPVEQNYDIRSSEAAEEVDDIRSSEATEEVDRSVPPAIQTFRSHNCHQSLESFPEAVIVVNTQNTDKEMIMSRRSTYQVILEMEKGGTQVVERDLDLPVDIVISSAICLVWYDNRNLRKKATPMTEASSSLPLCIENIATNDLTLLSFSFSGCFLVFEGDVNFISTVMESSDGIHAAGASLGIDLQIFFSYSSELTNEIIVSCIKYVTKLTRGLYNRMPESVTIAESFLTAFPSINPLTAHAILSSGAALCEFLKWSHEHRVRVLEKFNVPEQSIALFSAFCRYGEREDSKSIMTDCSSSVSSGPDSYRCQVDYERKRKKKISSPQEDELCFDELLQFEPVDQVFDGFLDSSTLSKHCSPGMTKDTGLLFGQKQGFDVTTIRKPSVSRPSCDSQNFKAPEKLEQLNRSSSSLKDKAQAPYDTLNTDMISKNLACHGLGNSKKVHEDITGKFIDLTDIPVRDKNFSFLDDSMDFLSLVTETEEDHMRKNKIARRLSFDKGKHPVANTSNIWSSLKDAGTEVENHPEPYFVKDDLPLDVRHSEKNSDEGSTQVTMRNLQGLPFQEEMSHLGETPLSRALRSASPLKNSPWTIEFINRIKEKSKLRQKPFSREKAAPSFGDSGNVCRVPKRRTPFISEFFKYQGSRPHGNIPEKKRQKQSVQSTNAVKNGKYLDFLPPTWTPNDKKARKTLTFATNDRGSQTKLVWSDGTLDSTKLRYQTQ